MREFSVEFYMDNGNEGIIKITGLKEKEMERWRKEMEARALSKYYKQKITAQKI